MTLKIQGSYMRVFTVPIHVELHSARTKEKKLVFIVSIAVRNKSPKYVVYFVSSVYSSLIVVIFGINCSFSRFSFSDYTFYSCCTIVAWIRHDFSSFWTGSILTRDVSTMGSSFYSFFEF